MPFSSVFSLIPIQKRTPSLNSMSQDHSYFSTTSASSTCLWVLFAACGSTTRALDVQWQALRPTDGGVAGSATSECTNLSCLHQKQETKKLLSQYFCLVLLILNRGPRTDQHLLYHLTVWLSYYRLRYSTALCTLWLGCTRAILKMLYSFLKIRVCRCTSAYCKCGYRRNSS